MLLIHIDSMNKETLLVNNYVINGHLLKCFMKVMQLIIAWAQFNENESENQNSCNTKESLKWTVLMQKLMIY